MIKVTVIVPVYNARQYLDECIQSVLNQDFSSFELLLINDGSTDNSGDICDHYGARDTRVKVWHKENGGVSSARNLGLDKATGEWITFIDSDDYISENYFAALAADCHQDLVAQGIKYVENGCLIKATQFQPEVLALQEFISKYPVYPYFSSSCSKFFKKSIIDKHCLNFYEKISYGEDTLFNLKYLRYCKNIETNDSLSYNYRLTGLGLSTASYAHKNDLLFYNETRELLGCYSNPEFYNRSIVRSLARLLTSIYHDTDITSGEREKKLKEVIETNYEVIFKIYTDPKIKFFIIIAYNMRLYGLLDIVLSILNRKE